MSEAKTREDLNEAQTLMTRFGERTGLAPERSSPTRYLWTDAFAVCNFLALARERPSLRGAYLELAGRLVRQVHRTLGYHREDDPREGPLSGLPPREADEQPTVAGLRIGNPRPERRGGEPYDVQLEPERDGQYLHYLTKWMHALNRMGTETGDAIYHRWARELAGTAHSAFVRDGAAGRVYWKMSVDLERPLIASTPKSVAQHNPLDALVTYCQLQSSPSGGGPDLRGEIHDAALMCAGASWATDDALAIGGLLFDAGRVAQLVALDAVSALNGVDIATQRDDLSDVIDALQPGPLLAKLLESARVGLAEFTRVGVLERPPAQRNAARELGLAIGLAALPVIAESRPSGRGDPAAGLERLPPHEPLRAEITKYWRDARHRHDTLALRDIEQVMLSTALVPDGFVRLR